MPHQLLLIHYKRIVHALMLAALMLSSGDFAAMQGSALASQDDRPVIVVLGDSLSAGYGLAQGEALPERLGEALSNAGMEAEIINAGVSGNTTADGLARIDWSVPDGTSGVILALGANDALRGIQPAVTRSNLEAMIARLKERGIAVLLAGMLAPPNMGEAYGQEFNAIFAELAEQHGIALYPFLLDGVAAQRELNQADGMHPNEAGISVMVDRMLPTLKLFLAPIGDGPTAEGVEAGAGRSK